MKILVDRHHADLLFSLQRLFEDRLDVGVYVPVGRGWWDEGYWKFGKSLGDDRLARQYLDIAEGVYEEIDRGVYRTYDNAHPDRPIYGVTLEIARAIPFDFTMPSVQENQAGYHRFAQEQGARYLYQVGNTGQQIDWSLDPLVLMTAEAEIKGRGVRLHQELSPAFSWHEPHAPTTVRNAVNAFRRLPGHADFLNAEAQLPGWTFTSHGHEGRDGDINPISALADLMASAGWGWHDKPVGDGFGHVVHAWAATGRPLIGHASYYKGKLAAPFWQDGVTCLDLAARPLDATVQLMQEIVADPARHLGMCQAIRAEFDKAVDYDEEARSVAALLGADHPNGG